MARVVRQKPLKDPHPVDSREESFPVFGLVMSWNDWHRAVDHMNYIGMDFMVAPHTIGKRTQDEYAIFCLYDPSDNILEFRAYRQS